MEGRGTFVIVASRITMNCARQTTTNVTSQWRATGESSVTWAVGERSVMRCGGGEGLRASGPGGPDDRSTSGPLGPSFRTGWSVFVDQMVRLGGGSGTV